jgi:putative hydrolase of the HAD superfamily
VARTAAVFFDVDFTLIHPGPRFQDVGYEASCARHGITVDPAAFETAVAGASSVLESSDGLHDGQLYVTYTRRIIELMGGSGPLLDTVAQEMYDDWAHHRYFSLYDDVVAALACLRERGIRVGLISNGNRCLESFQSHFELDGLIAAAISSAECGFMKPHPQIFHAALERLQVTAAEAAMVGDSLRHDVLGARQVGMRGIWLARRGPTQPVDDGVTVIRSLDELPELVKDSGNG